MRDEADFTAYAVARWVPLVRALVLLGESPERAHRVALLTLGRLRREWSRRDELGDLDLHLVATLLDARGSAAAPSTSAPTPAPTALPAALPPALTSRLAALSAADRAALVLPVVLTVSPDDVALLVGSSGGADAASGTDPVDPDDLRRAAESLPVDPLQVADAVAAERDERRARRRRTTRRSVAGLAAAAVVVGGWTWWAARPDPRPPLPDAPVERAGNVAPVGWYTDGVLHLAEVEIGLEALVSFVEVADGAVYADATGEVVHVDVEGRRTRLGTQRRDGTFAASADEGLVAWVQESDDVRELRVWDLAADEVVGTQPLADDEDVDVVALDAGVAYYVEQGRSLAYDVAQDDVAELADPRVLDVEAGAVARQEPDGVLSVASPRDVEDRIVRVPGLGAQLSPDGSWVLTRTVEPRTEQVTVRLHDTLQAREVPTGLGERAVVFAASVLEGGAATYLVELEQDEPDDGPRLSNSGSLQLTTCTAPRARPGRVAAPTCEVVRTFPRSTTWALAR